MIVRLEVSASEKVATRSQYEPNHYSVLVSVDQLSIEHPDELLGQADTLFRRAKEAIENAKRVDGLGAGPSQAAQPQPALAVHNGATQPPHHGSADNRATDKQLRLIHKLARDQRLDREGLEAACQAAVGRQSHELSKFDASRVIAALQGQRAS